VEVFTAENISLAYGVPVDVGVDPRTGRLRIDPVGHRPYPSLELKENS
jgi:iron complex transport system ATP-binding protein